MPIAATRAMLHAALSGALEDVEYRTDEVFGFEVPVVGAGRGRRSCSIPARPGATRRRTTRRRSDLARMFRENFERFDDAGLAEAGPRS